MPHLQAGQYIKNRYQLIRQLGEGGFSQVWLAEDMQLNIKKALKIYRGLSEEGLELFKKEYKRVHNLNHTYLLRPDNYDVTQDGVPFLIMRYYPRGSAEKLAGRSNQEQLAKVLAHIGGGLAYLQRPGISLVHQDIKPDNFIIDDDGNFLLTDFGISRDTQQEIARYNRQALHATPVDLDSIGQTPECYRGPEHYRPGSDRLPPSPHSDVWALGASLFEMATGEPPFGEIGGKMQTATTEIPPIPRNLGYFHAFNDIIAGCLHYDPTQRFTAAALAEKGEFFLREGHWPTVVAPTPQPIIPTPPEPPGPEDEPRKPLPVPPPDPFLKQMGVIIALLFLLGFGAIYFMGGSSDDDKTVEVPGIESSDVEKDTQLEPGPSLEENLSTVNPSDAEEKIKNRINEVLEKDNNETNGVVVDALPDKTFSPRDLTVTSPKLSRSSMEAKITDGTEKEETRDSIKKATQIRTVPMKVDGKKPSSDDKETGKKDGGN